MTVFRYRRIDDNEGAFTTVHGEPHGAPARYEVAAEGAVVGYVYKIETNVTGATYYSWIAETEPGAWPLPLDAPTRIGRTWPTRSRAAEALTDRQTAIAEGVNP